MNVSNFSHHFLRDRNDSVCIGEGEILGHEDILNENLQRTNESICIQDSLLGVINKNSFLKLLSNIERRITNEKISILQKIAPFAKLTRNTLAKLS